MNEKDLLKQLNELKNIKPASDWEQRNRDILLRQVFNSETKNEAFSGFDWVKGFTGVLRPDFLSNLHYSTVSLVLVVLFVFGGGFFSLKAAQDTKPGDSLYIAKIASEKTKLALAIGDKNKVRLGISFAGNRAEEIDKVLSESESADSSVINKEDREKVEKLVSDFNKEIDSVKSRIAKIGLKENKNLSVNTSDDNENNEEELVSDQVESSDDDQVFSANLGREDSGIQVSDPATSAEPVESNDIEEEVLDEVVDSAVAAATTSEESGDISTSSSEGIVEVGIVNPQSILKEAEDLLDVEDYEATLDKLDEAGDMVLQIGTGKVKGEEASSSSPEVILEEGL